MYKIIYYLRFEHIKSHANSSSRFFERSFIIKSSTARAIHNTYFSYVIMSSDNKGGGGSSSSSGSGERTPITHRTSSISIQSTTTRIVNTGNNMSVHSTHNSVEITSNMSSVDGDEDILSIEQTLEQVAASQSNNNRETRTRAGFNSISDALGNLRSRLHRHASSSGQSTSNGRRSVLQRLQDRLQVLDAAHSSRMPLHIMENRRNSMPNLMIHHQEGKEEEREKEEEEENNDSTRHRLTAASAPLVTSDYISYRYERNSTL